MTQSDEDPLEQSSSRAAAFIFFKGRKLRLSMRGSCSLSTPRKQRKVQGFLPGSWESLHWHLAYRRRSLSRVRWKSEVKCLQLSDKFPATEIWLQHGNMAQLPSWTSVAAFRLQGSRAMRTWPVSLRRDGAQRQCVSSMGFVWELP